MNAPRGTLFGVPEVPMGQRRKQAESVATRYPDSLLGPEEALDFLRHLFAPASLRWVYCGNGKTGTSSTKRFLFELEFGCPLTVSLKDDADMNDDPAPHWVGRSWVFRPLVQMPNGLEVLNQALRLTTARHPTARAVSSFAYLCRSDAEAHTWLAEERIRMNALTGMDWRSERDTPGGFLKFLDYLEAEAAIGHDRVGDPHLRPQVLNVRPGVFRPDLIGRTEALETFFRAVAERLDQPLPTDWTAPVSNSRDSPAAAALLTPDALTRLARVFAADYDWLNEDPASWRPEAA